MDAVPAAPSVEPVELVESVESVEPDDTRTRLLRAVTALLETGGEQAVKVRDVASALGVSIGAIYHHFGSREALIVAARIYQFEGLLRDDLVALRDVVGTASSVDDLRAGMTALTRAAQSPERAPYRQLRAEIAGNARHNADLAAALARAQEASTAALVDLFTEGRERGWIRADVDPRAAAVLVQAVPLGLVLDDVNTIGPMSLDGWWPLIDRVYDVLLAD